MLAAIGFGDLYSEIISNTGLVGVLFVLVVFALVWRDRELSKERSARLVDAKCLSKIIEANTLAQREANIARLEQSRLVARLSENLARLDGHIGK